MKNWFWIGFLFIVGLFLGVIVLSVFIMTKQKPLEYEEILVKNRGIYTVKEVLYTGTSLEFTKLESIMKSIRSTCKKPCKINLYSTREAYQLDILIGDPNFTDYTDEQKSYLSEHVLAFWGIDEGDIIEYYPKKD